MNTTFLKMDIMNKETSVLMAGAIGLLGVLSVFWLRRTLKNKAYKTTYQDYHRNLIPTNAQEEYHGVEYFSVR